MADDLNSEIYLKIYRDRSILINEDGQELVFHEGTQDENTQVRYRKIEESLRNGFLTRIIEECKNLEIVVSSLSDDDINLLNDLVDSLTSEVGRAIVGLTVLQLAVKSIEPNQSIRLHKSGRGDFSWVEGIPMRTLDNRFITPVLRQYNLLRLNADGFMMTRSLAENYPYTKLYKAAIRGAKEQWLEIVDRIESGTMDAKPALKVVISALMRRSDNFISLATSTLVVLNDYLSKKPTQKEILDLIKDHINHSAHSARLLEISLHSLFQALFINKFIGDCLKPLSQMRSANKKHGNIGDIEITTFKNPLYILESWDAKYGKPYLRDEIEELSEKLENHPETEVAGFVVNIEPDLRSDIIERIREIEEIHNTKIFLYSFDEFIKTQLKRFAKDKKVEELIVNEWIKGYTESLCQKRRDLAPIDEPCDIWLTALKEHLEAKLK
jgi:hypothetical protein